jgi:hypothetical protein
MTHCELLGAAVWKKPPRGVRKIAAYVVFTGGSAIRPKTRIAGQPNLPGTSYLVSELGPGDNGNPIAVRPGSQAIFEIKEVHKQIGAGQSYVLYHVPPHHASRTDDKVNEPDRLF